MRNEMIETNSRAKAKKLMPWAAKIVRVEGGYRGFESLVDYKIWKNQK